MENMNYDGWILRFSKGYTKRANSVQPIYLSSEDVGEKIRICEEAYASRGLDVVFKVTPHIYPSNLDELLDAKGYNKASPTSIQVLNLDKVQGIGLGNIEFESHVTEMWNDEFYRLSGKDVSTKSIHFNMLNQIIPTKFFALISLNGENIACGLGVLENSFIGLFDIVVDKGHRNMGYGKKLVLSLLNLGKNNGAKQAYLQVEKNNEPALKLYSGMGFKEIYEYWYRVKA